MERVKDNHVGPTAPTVLNAAVLSSISVLRPYEKHTPNQRVSQILKLALVGAVAFGGMLFVASESRDSCMMVLATRLTNPTNLSTSNEFEHSQEAILATFGNASAECEPCSGQFLTNKFHKQAKKRCGLSTRNRNLSYESPPLPPPSSPTSLVLDNDVNWPSHSEWTDAALLAGFIFALLYARNINTQTLLTKYDHYARRTWDIGKSLANNVLWTFSEGLCSCIGLPGWVGMLAFLYMIASLVASLKSRPHPKAIDPPRAMKVSHKIRITGEENLKAEGSNLPPTAPALLPSCSPNNFVFNTSSESGARTPSASEAFIARILSERRKVVRDAQIQASASQGKEIYIEVEVEDEEQERDEEQFEERGRDEELEGEGADLEEDEGIGEDENESFQVKDCDPSDEFDALEIAQTTKVIVFDVCESAKPQCSTDSIPKTIPNVDVDAALVTPSPFVANAATSLNSAPTSEGRRRRVRKRTRRNRLHITQNTEMQEAEDAGTQTEEIASVSSEGRVKQGGVVASSNSSFNVNASPSIVPAPLVAHVASHAASAAAVQGQLGRRLPTEKPYKRESAYHNFQHMASERRARTVAVPARLNFNVPQKVKDDRRSPSASTATTKALNVKAPTFVPSGPARPLAPSPQISLPGRPGPLATSRFYVDPIPLRPQGYPSSSSRTGGYEGQGTQGVYRFQPRKLVSESDGLPQVGNP